MQCCLWFRMVIRMRGPWPKRYGYNLSINFLHNYHYKEFIDESSSPVHYSS